MRGDRDRFNLLRYFAAVGLLANAVIVAGLAVLLPALAQREILALTASAGAQLGRSLAEELLPAASDPRTAVEEPGFAPRLASALADTPIVKIKIWDDQGTVVYSTDPAVVGSRNPTNPALVATLEGRTYSKVEHSKPGDSPGEGPLSDIVEVYVPIEGPDGAALGAFEVYLPVDLALQQRVSTVVRKIVYGTLATLALQFLLLLAVAHRGHRLIGHTRRLLKRAQREALRAAERKVRQLSRQNDLILRSAGEGICGLDPDGRVTFVNPAASRMLGRRAEELLGEPFEMVLHPPGGDGSASSLDSLTGLEEAVLWRPDGGSFLAECTRTAIEDRSGQALGTVITFRDITARREAESRLRQARRSLRRYAARLEEKEQRLSRLVQKLIGAQEEERRVVANDLHDGLLQHVVAADMHLQAFAAGLPSHQRADHDLQRSLERVRSALREGRLLIANLRPFTLDQEGLVEAVRRHLVQPVEDRGVRVSFRAQVRRPLPPDVETSAFRIVQEALNNALKHSGSDRLELRLESRNGLLRLQVRDWGRGFELSTSSRREGSLGLVTMQERAEVMGGRYRIESQPGRGTRIQVELPVAEGVGKAVVEGPVAGV